MPFDVGDSRPIQPSKSILDKRSFDNVVLTERMQFPPTPPTREASLEAHESKPTPLAPPEPSPSWKKRAAEDETAACRSPSKKRRIEVWLKGLGPKRATSCPPRIEESIQQKEEEEQQRPLLQFLREMSQSRKSQKQSGASGTTTSTRSQRPPTSSIHYRKILRNNGVYIDLLGEMIPSELRNLLDSHILKERSSKLSPEVLTRAVRKALNIADAPESSVYDLTDEAILPIKRDDVARGGNTQWYPDSLPRDDLCDTALALPKPDIHCGYPIDESSGWKHEENVVIDHAAAIRFTQPAKGNSFPFFVLDLKSEATGGNLWQAENQAAGAGACCVKSVRWLFEQAYPSQTQSVVDSIAFSACFTYRRIYFSVHFYSPELKRYYKSSIADLDTLNKGHVQRSHDIVNNIFDYCLGDRQKMIRRALASLLPFPSAWKHSRSQATHADDEEGSQSQRME